MDCQVCEALFFCTMDHVQLGDDWIARVPAANDCLVCGVKASACHHADCSQERCPVCGDFLTKCGCFPAVLMLGAA